MELGVLREKLKDIELSKNYREKKHETTEKELAELRQAYERGSMWQGILSRTIFMTTPSFVLPVSRLDEGTDHEGEECLVILVIQSFA
ncbi:hypothetical protein AgCh_001165 [Apium graveolens]